jgi:enoyl-CoA hydratase/carnithine racemase
MIHAVRRYGIPRTYGMRALSTATVPKPNRPSWEPVATHIYPGSRALELGDMDNGNPLTRSTIAQLALKMRQFNNNNAVSVVLLTSRLDPDRDDDNIFSVGLDVTMDNRDIELATNAQKLAAFISDHTAYTIAVYEGDSSGSPYGLFGGSKYRVASCNSQLQLNELAQGLLPLGGMARHMVKGCKEGLAFSRYVAVSQRWLASSELYSLGLVSHILPQECYTTLLHALGRTLSAE